MTTWEKVKDSVKFLKINETVRREVLLPDCDHTGTTTIDNYRNYLCKAGYLRIVGRGLYQKIRNLEKDMSTTKIFNLAYRKEYPTNFY